MPAGEVECLTGKVLQGGSKGKGKVLGEGEARQQQGELPQASGEEEGAWRRGGGSSLLS